MENRVGSNKLTEYNCLQNVSPKLVLEWNFAKNNGLTPKNVSFSSGKKVFWQCQKGHEWEATIASRSRGCGCPYCSGLKLLKENSLESLLPELSLEWHPTKNNNRRPCDVSAHSHTEVWWQCKHLHEWVSSINNRSKGNGCPYCMGKRISEKNSLSVKHPNLALEWDHDKNGSLVLGQIFERSNSKVWWKCSLGHSYYQTVDKRVSRGIGCPYCKGYLPTKENCLLTLYPELCREWDYDKNTLLPSEVTAHSANKFFWKCSKGHEWQARLDSRVRGCTDCPNCNGILLKDGSRCDSKVEAVKYIDLKENSIPFELHKRYRLGKDRRRHITYDFYLPLENKFIEVTSYTRKNLSSQPGRYFRYLRGIVKKKNFAENVLGSKFQFIQFSPTAEQIINLRKYTC